MQLRLATWAFWRATILGIAFVLLMLRTSQMTTPYEAPIKMPQVGEPAPKFKLPAYPSGTISLDDYAGKKNVILAFYPKDDTPGCTKEMCSFSEDLSHFEAAGTQVLGISCDSVSSHQSFAGKFSLKQPLLSDGEGTVARAYGVVREGRAMANRVLFVIDKSGIIRHVVEGMPENADLLELVKKL
ncbi:MAG TPA: peroxiredoxin [Candidatus Obscuribacterales bacterium]